MIFNDLILEACVSSVISSVRAEKNGAHQLELCSRLDLGGLTPDINFIKAVRAQVDIPIKVMLRNRGGDFVYSQEDVVQMKISLSELIQLDIQGIVFGALHHDKSVNIALTQHICEFARGLPVTFHKAIDCCPDILLATAALKMTDVRSILTSGGNSTATQGVQMLKQIIEIAGPEIDIISAGKITSHNINVIHKSIGGKYYHGKLIVGAL